MISFVATIPRRPVLCGLLLSLWPWWESAALDKALAARVSPVGAPNARAGFVLLSPDQTGIAFTNGLSPASAARNQILLNGSGVAAGDFDGDGLCDLFFCSLEGESKLYRNLGNWRFKDVTLEAGLAGPARWSTGAVLADLDGDGDLDLMVNSVGGGTRLFINDGGGHFVERMDSGLAKSGGSTSFAVADIDGDGALDVYVVNYRSETIRSTGFPTINVSGRRMLPPEFRGRLEISPEGRVLEYGEPDVLYLNDGSGRFSAAPWTNGRFLDEGGQSLRAAPLDWGLSAMFYDLNSDGAPDLYVCNDFQTPDRLWMNDGKGHFRAAPSAAWRKMPTFSMSVDFADFDRDGVVDFLAADMLEARAHMRLCQTLSGEDARIGGLADRVQVERNTLQRGRGDGSFEEVASYYGLDATGWSWNVAFMDVDLDGFEDLLVTRGNMFNTQDRDANERIERGGPYSREAIPGKLLQYPALLQSKGLFRNQRGLSFEDASQRWGFDQVGASQGICFADLDNDGDLDVIVNNLNGPAGLYRNDSTAPRVAVRLQGSGGNTRGIGARIELLGGAVPVQQQQMICGGRYLSSDEPIRVFAAGPKSEEMSLVVTWRGGGRTVVDNVQPNSIYTIAQADSLPAAAVPKPARKPLFEEAAPLLSHQHHEEAFDDFARQGLLPKKLSQLGPGLAWADLNGDGLDDLIIGSGRGGPISVFENHGTFIRRTNSFLQGAAPRDQTTVLGFVSEDGSSVVLAGLANYEDGQTNGASLYRYDFAKQEGKPALPAGVSSPGPLALADMDGDGVLELFVGGRVIPGRYPEAASSSLYHQRTGQWILDEANSAVLREVGMVSGAVWTDLNRDGYPELVLACEWGSVKIFQNEKGRLRDSTASWQMGQRVGWWNGVTAGDFDGDGKMDLLVSNWGLNTRYHLRNGHGPRIYYGSWGGAGEIEPLEAAFDESIEKWIPERDLNSVGRSIPSIREEFQTHRAYALAGIESILGERLKRAAMIEATWLETTVFLNRGDHFELGKLPVAAQFSPAFGVNVADFDGDGREDVFLSQNFFAVQPQTSRNDSGRGLILLGDGRGGFAKLDGADSGVKVYGEQRGSAVADYDGDGRVDLAVTQNGASTLLFHNNGGRPGLRVRLRGGPGNPQSFGAILRVGFENGWGPAREIHAGSGYWSQDSATQVMALPSEPKRLQVLWPGGQLLEVDCPRAAREIEIDQAAGKLRVVR